MQRENIKRKPAVRKVWLDAVKGLGILLVVWSHLPRIPKIGPIIKKDYSENFLDDTYEQNQIKMYISSGIGTENINFRFNNMPSINLYRFYNYS